MKVSIPAILISLMLLCACGGSHDKTGGAAADSGAKSSTGGPADTTKAIGSGTLGQSATSPGRSDTSKKGAVAAPGVDSSKNQH